MSEHVVKDSHQSELRSKNDLDRWGAILGFICAIHCALTPLSMVLIPIFGLGALWTTQGEFILLSIAFLLTLPSAWGAWKRDQDLKVILGFVIAWALLTASFMFKEAHGLEDLAAHTTSSTGHSHEHLHEHSTVSIVFAVLGGLGLMLAHLLNLKARRSAHSKCCSHD